MVYKCKNCDGNVIYSPEKHRMICPYCDSEESEERRDLSSAALNICPNCGGEIPLLQYTAATQCPYCENYLILNERVEGEYEPQLILPFQIGKENCKKRIREKFKKFLFAPTDFLSEVRLNGMQGIYVPFWFYDYDVTYDYQGEGRKVRTWVAGNTEYTEVSLYDIRREMNVDFRKIPADASIEMPDDVMDLMEPYGYQQLEAFNPKFLSGFYAEKYNMKAEEIEQRAQQKMRDDAKQMLQSSYSGYNSVKEIRSDIRLRGRNVNYGMLPVWRYQYVYKQQVFPFYVNGQTGKIVGMAPLSKAKVWAYAGTLWACLTCILLLLDCIFKTMLL